MNHLSKLLSAVFLIVFLGIGIATKENHDAEKAREMISLKRLETHTGKIVYGRKYRYVMNHRFRKTRPGVPLRFVYLPVPPSDDYQEISNVAAPGGELFDNPGSRQKYARYTITDPDPTTWFEVTLEFDYIPKGTEFSQAVVKEVLPYDTSSKLYKEYTSKYNGFIDTDNVTLRKASDMLWSRSANAYEYAQKCSQYIMDTFDFIAVDRRRTISELIARKGGDCGNLSSLFITLLRCKKVPARHVIVPNHVWAEFYLEGQGWIPVDPTFKLFGKANRSYERLIWSHEIVFHLKTSETDSFETMDRQHHILYPSHEPYECGQEITLWEIKE
ncbi:MAG: transglutaminase-like domain-containing protein [Phycisphaerales bacterium]|jgi:transglutaminase-like putative cysteine protease